ncbi:MAG TPA: hybrid sensor histidine kinase/response regulator [Candidatus Polarisedimenticolaceae bacterium]|nr:hybrid sensor histidine kinase/response regulator [Candidatus Polarisedimenticolaceae bacterium]
MNATATKTHDVLVVDDDPRNRRLLEEYLVSAGYEVRLAPDGESALRMAAERPPDLVLLDVMMPDLSGLEVCRRLKADPRTRLAQVVLVTALDGTPHKVEGLDTGADDYVAKPVRREEFMAKVRSLLRARRLMAELEEARATLAARNAKLEELEALKETLTQTLVHDLKNPLAAVLGNLELMERKVGEPALHLVVRSKAAAWRMHQMILNLLDVGQLEEGKLHLNLESVDARTLVKKACQEMEHASTHRKVSFDIAVGGEEGTIRGDAAILRRVIDNLLSNAIEHSPTDGKISVKVIPCDEGVEIAVADQGRGVPPEFRERIFEKFQRLESRKTVPGANRGLGLTFCRLAVEAHGGTIWVDDAPGGGAMFRALLPSSEEGAGEMSAERKAAG